MREKFRQVYKVHDQRGVKFTESDEVFEIAENTNQIDYLFDADLLSKDDDNDDLSVHANKRNRESGDDIEVIPTKKRVVRSIFDGQNLDATQVLEKHDDLNFDDGNMNATFAIKPKASVNGVNGVKGTQVRVLKESNPNVHKGFAAPKTTTKPITKVKSTLIVPMKENKRTPLSIRRSPRRSPRSASKYMIFLRMNLNTQTEFI